MITIQSNLEEVLTTVHQKLSAVDVDKMTRLQATSLMAAMRQRIHVDGKASDGVLSVRILLPMSSTHAQSMGD